MGMITIQQERFFNTTAADVYTILMDERKHSAFTGCDEYRIPLANVIYVNL